MYRDRYLYALEHGMASPDTGLNAAELVKGSSSDPFPENRREPTECNTPCWMAAMWEGTDPRHGGESHGKPRRGDSGSEEHLVRLQQQFGKERNSDGWPRHRHDSVPRRRAEKCLSKASPRNARVAACSKWNRKERKSTSTRCSQTSVNVTASTPPARCRPCAKADDAHVLDNDGLTREQQMDRLLELYHEAIDTDH